MQLSDILEKKNIIIHYAQAFGFSTVKITHATKAGHLSLVVEGDKKVVNMRTLNAFRLVMEHELDCKVHVLASTVCANGAQEDQVKHAIDLNDNQCASCITNYDLAKATLSQDEIIIVNARLAALSEVKSQANGHSHNNGNGYPRLVL